MTLTENMMGKFFPDDNRFLHFVARKHGMFFLNQDDVETARHIAIINVMKIVSCELEFENKAHLNSVVEKNFKHAIYAMISFNSAKKRSIDIQSESEFIAVTNGESSSALERHGELDDPYKNELMDDFKVYVRDNMDAVYLKALNLHLDGYNNVESSKILGISPEAFRQRIQKIKKHLKKHYEADEKPSSRDDQKVRARVRGKSTSADKAKQSDYSEAMSYIGIEA